MIDNLTIFLTVDDKPCLVDTRGISIDMVCKMLAGFQESKTLKLIALDESQVDFVNIAEYLKPKEDKND